MDPDPHIDPQEWAERQRRNYRTSLRCWWGRERGVLCLLDPHTGEVIEVDYHDAPKWMVKRAFDEKDRRRGALR